MPNPEKIITPEKSEAIWDRQEIKAPPDFVSIYHETKKEFLYNINAGGLTPKSEVSNIGQPKEMKKRNLLLDEFRPKEIKAKGISRSNTYGYPYLEHGHGLLGADRRHIKKDLATLKFEFEGRWEYARDFLVKNEINSLDQYIAKMNDPKFLRTLYQEGEILELKVDPNKCYVGDLEYITRISDLVSRGWSLVEAVEEQAKYYWGHLVTLKDFLQWYRKPEWAEDGDSIKNPEDYKDGEPFSTSEYCLLKGAPDNLPASIHNPEVLIPEIIPPKYIKVVK